MKFMKMHGLGNDFIVLNGFADTLPVNPGDFAIAACNRNLGIGADGVLMISPSELCDFKLTIYNSDGSQPEMCGNGIRCVSWFAYQQGIVQTTGFTVETLAGIMKPQILDIAKKMVQVDMGIPCVASRQIPCNVSVSPVINYPVILQGVEYHITAVSMGNPHCIIFVKDVDNFPVAAIGALLEKHLLFPAGTNVEFVEILNHSHVKMRVWERGCGQTLACGTGACATAVAAVLNKYTDRSITVELALGCLELEWSATTGHVLMTGPCEPVFTGEYHPVV